MDAESDEELSAGIAEPRAIDSSAPCQLGWPAGAEKPDAQSAFATRRSPVMPSRAGNAAIASRSVKSFRHSGDSMVDPWRSDKD